MSVSFRVLPKHFLVYGHFDGRMGIAESAQALADIADPDDRKGMREPIDLSDLTDWERDFPAIMRLDALEAEIHDDPYRPTPLVCLAPNDHARSLAQVIDRTWDTSRRKLTVTVESEPEAFAVLGIDVPSISTRLQIA